MAVPPTPGVPLGTLDGAEVVRAEPRGAVRFAPGWELDWWIGAEDRWHVPAESPTVRQALLGASPVTETRVRVPSGDAVQRLYAVRARSGADLVVAEVLNETKVPFAVTFVLRAVDGRGPAEIEVTDRAVLVDGVAVAGLPKVPGRIAFADGDDELRAVVEGGNAGLPGGRGLAGKGTQVALLYPLAHTASVRIAVPVALVAAGAADGIDDVGGLPDAKQVVSGWQTQARRGTRVVLPERRVQDTVDARVRRALLLGADDPYAAETLDLFGFPDEAGDALRPLLDDVRVVDEPGRVLRSVARHAALRGDAAFADEVAVPVAELVARLATSSSGPDLRRGASAAPLAAEVLRLAGHKRGARDVERAGQAMAARADALVDAPAADDDLALDERVRATVRAANSTATWAADDARTGADLVASVRGLLVEESPGGLALSPVVPSTWLGQGWELHDAPTIHGVVGFAVRWHGDRPALLWDLARRSDAPVELTAPGLDPTWSSTEPRGEALLAPVALPPAPERKGLTIPVSIEPMPRR